MTFYNAESDGTLKEAIDFVKRDVLQHASSTYFTQAPEGYKLVETVDGTQIWQHDLSKNFLFSLEEKLHIRLSRPFRASDLQKEDPKWKSHYNELRASLRESEGLEDDRLERLTERIFRDTYLIVTDSSPDAVFERACQGIFGS